MSGELPEAPAAKAAGAAEAPEIRVTTLELFFDLIFAFTLTQLTVLLDAQAPRPGRAPVRAALVDVRGLRLADEQSPGASADRRPGLALSACFYAHMPMLLGIVLAAAGVTAATRHGERGGLAAALALGIGSAAFAGGTAAFRAALGTGPTRLRLAMMIFALATVPLGSLVAVELQLGLLTIGLALLLAAERNAPLAAGPSAQSVPEPAASPAPGPVSEEHR